MKNFRQNITMVLRITLLSLALFPQVPLYSAVPLVLNQNRDRYEVGLFLECLEDRHSQYTIETVQGAPFKGGYVEAPNFGFTSSAAWGRFTILVPPGNREQWFLEIGYPLLDSIELYMPARGGGFTVRHGGDSYPFDQREVEFEKFIFALDKEPGTYTYYLRIKTTSSLIIPLTIYTQKRMISEVNTHQMQYGIFYGALIIMIIINLLLALYTRDITFYYYVVFIISFIFVSLTMSGTGFQYLWRNALWMNDLTPFAILFCFLWVIIFTRSFLYTRHIVPFFDRLILAFIIITVLLSAAALFVPYSIGIRVSAAYAILIVPLAFFTGGLTLKRGVRQARFFLIAFAFFLLGVLVTALNRFGLLPSNTFTVWAFQFGILLQVALISIALGDRLITLKQEKEKAQAEVLRYQEQLIESLRRSDRLKDEFLNNLSHELKTPLQVIYSYAELIKDDDEGDIDALKSFGDKIYGNIDKLKTYIEDLVLITDLEASPSLSYKKIPLSEIVSRSLSKYSSLTAERKLKVNSEISGLISVEGDERYLQKAVDHLIRNAVLFNRNEGTIDISASESSGTAKLFVKDSGIGISGDDIEKIWDKFYRADNSLTYEVSGVGIGLFLAKRIMELHGSRITAESEPDRGSLFTITFFSRRTA